MTTAVKNAINESILRDRIVLVEGTTENIEALDTACDDSVDNGPEIEFWGTDEDGDNWRVHAAVELDRR
jgi:hypothetical protein